VAAQAVGRFGREADRLAGVGDAAMLRQRLDELPLPRRGPAVMTGAEPRRHEVGDGVGRGKRCGHRNRSFRFVGAGPNNQSGSCRKADCLHVREWRNAAGVLATACPGEWQDIIDVLRGFRLLRSEVQAEKQFQTAIKIDEELFESPTHKIDCLKGRVALEVEWNKDPFFDRDLNNFRLLFDLRAIDVGVIVTRGSELQTIFKGLGKGASYGSSTTHHEKLWPRIEGGGGGGCPVLTFAITPELYVDDGPPTAATAAEMAAEPHED
jgi:hypothetical protein